MKENSENPENLDYTSIIDDDAFWNELEKEDNKIIKWTDDMDTSAFNDKYKEMLDMMSENESSYNEVKIGDIVTGQIETISKRELKININYKDSIYVENKLSDFKIIQNLKVGDEIDVMIIKVIDNPFQIKGSITDLIKAKVSHKLKDYYKENRQLVVKVIERIPAGFMLDIELDNITIKSFMPNILAGINKLTDEQSSNLVGSRINVLLESLQQEKGVYVVSRKKYLKTLIPVEISKLKKTIAYKGTVTGTMAYGVFVQFNECLTGMIHKVNLNPEWKIDQVQPGMEVTFYVRDILKGNKIILSQFLRESLWDKIKVGQIKDGKVKSIKSFGVLVELDPETTGLIQNTYIQKADKKLEVGKEVKVKVISVIRDDRKIYLDFPN